MFKATLIPEAGGTPFVFFNSTRSLVEMNVRLNHQPMFQTINPIRAQFAVKMLRGQRRNLITLSVRRDVDIGLVKTFPDAEAAMAFAFDSTVSVPVIGTLKLELKGKSTDRVFWMKNATIPGHSMTEWVGKAPLFEFTFDGGEIVKNSPLIK